MFGVLVMFSVYDATCMKRPVQKTTLLETRQEKERKLESRLRAESE